MASLLALLAILMGCDQSPSPPRATQPSPTETPQPWFKDVAGDSGIDFVWHSGADDSFLMPEIVGGGVAMIDYDMDGDEDLYFIQGGNMATAWKEPQRNTLGNRMYRNDGNMRFTDVTERTRTGDGGYGMGVAVGDIDNDGDPDLYLTNVGRNTMLRNDQGVFTDITDASGTGDTGWGASATFVDADLDGDLDLFATRYLKWTPDTELTCYSPLGGEDYCSPRNYLSPAVDIYYRNLGDGRFEDATVAAGFDQANGTGLGVIHADINGDRRPDFFVANDGMRDLLWVSHPSGQWKEAGMERGCAVDDEGIAKAGMGVDAADIDDDNDFDLIVCNLTGESDSIFRNDGDYFVDITGRTGVRAATRHATRFGLAWRDFDHDGWLDLFEANGAVTRQNAPPDEDPYAQSNTLLKGSENGRFSVLDHGLSPNDVLTSRAAAFGDLDGDGGIDIVIVNRDAPITLLHNVHPDRGNWIGVDLRDASGRPAIGAELRCRLGERTLLKQVQRAGSYMAMSDPTIHIGLGEHAFLEDVTIRWPNGQTAPLGRLEGGRVHEVTSASSNGRSEEKK